MVVVPLRESGEAWDLLRGGLAQSDTAFLMARHIASSTAANNGGPVLIFTAAADPDALASVRTLTALLKADLIRYQVHPVDGYEHMRDKFTLLVTGDAAVEPRAVLCVNCGAMVDLNSALLLPENEDEDDSQISPSVSDLRVLIIDSHRPYHLRNVNSEKIVLLHDSDDFNESELPINMNMEDEWGNVPDEKSSDESSDQSESDGESDSESESDISDFIDDDDAPGKDDRQSDIDDNEHATSNLPPAENDDSLAVTQSPESQAAKKRERHTDLNGTEESESNASKAKGADESGEPPADDDEDSDEEGIMIRKGTRKRRQADSPGSAKQQRKKARSRRRRAHRSRPANDPALAEKRRLRTYYSNATVATSSACVSHGIAMLMRRGSQDSLWMAILGVTSQYMTSSISNDMYDNQTSFCQEEVKVLQPNEQPLDEETSAVQNVGYVPSCTGSAVQRIAQSVELRLDLLRHWSLYGSLMHSSYTATRLATWRQTGRRRLLEMLATVGIPLADSKQQWCYMKQKNKVALDKNLSDAISRFDLGDSIHYDSFVRTLPGHRGDISAADFVHAVTALLEVDDSRWDHHSAGAASALDRFWRAYDALDSKRVKLLEDGLDLAMFVQKLTSEIGGDVIERRKFVPSGPFRYVFLRDEQHKEFLTQPILLRRLALFLNTALLRQGAKDKPFIILAPDVGRSVWIAVAATTCTQRNDFGQRFRKAAERNGSTVTYSGFDSSVCEIKDGQEIEFVRFLHDVM